MRDAGPDQHGQAISTDCLSTWIDAIRATFVELHVSPTDRDYFHGSLTTRHLAHLMAAELVVSGSQTFDRTATLTSRHSSDLFQVGLVAGGEAQLIQDGRACELQSGDLAIYETSRPFTWSLRSGWHLRVFTWPRSTVSLVDSESRALTARRIPADSPIGSLLSPTLLSLLASDAEFSSTGAIRLADHIAELAITAAYEESHTDAGSATDSTELYSKVLEYIQINLGDPELGPQSIAQAFFISPRTLHRLFARNSDTVATRIRHRRLEACRKAMTTPTGRTLTDIATQFGFIDLASFSRSFATVYGSSPSRYRSLRT